MKETPSFLKINSIVLFAFFILTLFFYRNTFHAKFTYDFVTSIVHSEKGFYELSAYSEFLPIAHWIGFLLYKLFGVNGLPSYIICSFWHSLNACLVFILTRKILIAAGNKNVLSLPVVSSLMFLLSPYQTEVVIWQAAIHYLATGTILLGSILLTIKYTHNRNRILLFIIPFLFFTGLFTHESAFAIPFMLVLIIFIGPSMLINFFDKKKMFVQIVVPQLLLIIIYFVIVKVFAGVYVSHYSGNPIKWIQATGIIGNYLKYFLKFIIFLPLWKFSIREKIYDIAEMPVLDWCFFILLSVIVITLFIKRSHFSEYGKVLFLMFLLFMLAIAPFSIIPYRPIFFICNERHAYLPSMFFYPLFVLLIAQLLNKYRYAIIGIYLIVSLFFLHRLTGYWAKAGKVQESLIWDFRWFDKDNIYILSNPNRFEGAWMFESYGDTFGDAIKVYTGKDIRSRVKEVTQFNMVGTMDSVSVSRKSDSTLSIWATVPGTWLWHHGVGLTSYETDDYKITAGDLNCDFTLKKKLPNSVYIYSVGGKWKEAKF